MDLAKLLHGFVKIPESYQVEASPLSPTEIIPAEWRTWENYLKHGGRALMKEELKIIILVAGVELFIPKDCLIFAEGGECGFILRWAANTKKVFFCDGCPRNDCQHQGKVLIQ